MPSHRFVLVLGAGGTVGMAFHTGVLKALDDSGLRPDGADLIVGTSAGAFIGALLRTGSSPAELWDVSQARQREGAAPVQLFRPAWRTPLGFARRAAGSGWVVARSVGRRPRLPVPPAVARALGGGMVSRTMLRDGIGGVLGEQWPEQPLWLCTVDLTSGRRVVLGRRGASKLPLAEAVRASCAVPGLFPPVQHGRRSLVDGGAHSPTNADLAGKVGPALVVVSAPMACERGALDFGNQAVRGAANRRLAREVGGLRRGGAEVIEIKPTAADARRDGLHLIRPGGHQRVAVAAYEAARAALAGRNLSRVGGAAAPPG